MARLLATLLVATAALGPWSAAASADDIVWGVNDDVGKFDMGDSTFWTTLRSVGLTSDTMTVRWDDTSDTGFDGNDAELIGPALDVAAAAGVNVTFAVYPRHSSALSSPGNAARFAAWLTTVAEKYPQVHDYAVMNECNTSLFVNPQYVGAKNVSAARCGIFLAAAYDALKAVDPAIFVWGLGLSPRGNPVPKDKSSPRATNPIDWLGFLGQWYRHSGRALPLMDGLDVHPYPIPQNLPFESGYSSPTAFSVTNLPRAYQAFYTAFRTTPQPTVGPGRLPVSLNEVGIQTVPPASVASSYTGVENAAGVAATGTEAYQATWYRKLIDFALCDADVKKVDIFKLVDETGLEGWQSGLFYVGYVPKLSSSSVPSELARTAAKCPTGDAAFFAPGTSQTPPSGVDQGLVRKIVKAARAGSKH
jgi:hypothetical protein